MTVELIDKTSFRFIGRLDDTINSGGIKIQPLEIEKYFAREGLEVYISSIPNDEFGEAVVLVTQSLMSKEWVKYLRPYQKINGPNLN